MRYPTVEMILSAKTSDIEGFMAEYEKGTEPSAMGHRSWKDLVSIKLKPCDSEEFGVPNGAPVIGLDNIVARQWGKGHGTAAMKWLLKLADKYDVDIYLCAVPYGNGPQKMSEKKLIQFYKGLGFKSWMGPENLRYLAK